LQYLVVAVLLVMLNRVVAAVVDLLMALWM